MATYNKFEDFTEQMAKGIHQLHAAGHTLKVYLTNVLPDANADAIKTDLAEIAAGNGYTAGGEDVQNDVAEAAGVMSLTGVDVVITAAGGTIGPFRYVVLYNDTAASDNLIAWWDYGSAITLNSGESLTIDFGTEIMTLT